MRKPNTLEVTADHYLIDGRKYDRVSNVIASVDNKPFFKGKNLDQASDRGTLFHAEIARLLTIRRDNPEAWEREVDSLAFDNSEVAGMVKVACRWINENDVQPLEIEATVWDDANEIAGTIDMIAYVQGKVCLVDWKTGSTSKIVNWSMQTMFYARMAKDYNFYRRIIVCVPNGLEVAKEVTFISETIDSKACDCALFLFRYKQNK